MLLCESAFTDSVGQDRIGRGDARSDDQGFQLTTVPLDQFEMM